MSPPTGETTIAVQWTFTALSMSLFVMRVLMARLKISRQYLFADAFFYAGCACAVALAICDTMLFSYGILNPLPAGKLVPSEIISKISFAAVHFYNVGLFFPKASMLAFYFDLIPITYPRLRQSLVIIAIYVAVASVAIFLSDFLWCPHISDNWTWNSRHCSLLVSEKFLQLSWALNISSDVLVFILPLPMLKDLHLHGLQRIGVIFTFCVGLITMSTSIARFAALSDNPVITSILIWSAAEINTALIVVSLPKFSFLLKRLHESRKSNRAIQNSPKLTSAYTTQN